MEESINAFHDAIGEAGLSAPSLPASHPFPKASILLGQDPIAVSVRGGEQKAPLLLPWGTHSNQRETTTLAMSVALPVENSDKVVKVLLVALVAEEAKDMGGDDMGIELHEIAGALPNVFAGG
jgi:hypothetical protein